jgi:ribosomal-protein-alanine N-acetyltransferase
MTRVDGRGSSGSMPAFHSRSMVLADLAEVARIEARVFTFPWTFGNFVDALQAGYQGWVFESAPDSARIWGYALVMKVADEAHLLNLSVDEVVQGRGLGSAMLEFLIREAQQAGLTAMLLEVRPSNLMALRLYERRGFHRVGLRRRYYPAAQGQREDAIVMTHRWAPAHE